MCTSLPTGLNSTLLGIEYNAVSREGEQADIMSTGHKRSILDDPILAHALES